MVNRTSSTKNRRPSRHKRRLLIMQGALLVALGLVAARMQYVSRVFGPGLLAQANKNDVVNGVLLAPRGSLLDSSGHKLALDLQAYTMDIHTSLLTAVEPQVASLVASALGVSIGTVNQWLTNPTAKWVEWQRPVLEPAKEQIYAGIHKLTPKQDIGNLVTFYPTEQRFYPNGVFASNVLGYVNSQDVGVTGLEWEYNQQLQGTNGVYQYTRQADGFPLQTSIKTLQQAKPGDDVQLTIDSTIQGFVEQEMDSLVKQYHPQNAGIVVTNPKTGAVLAMTSRPTFDPNQYWKSTAPVLNSNWAVTTAFEPGSTFKVAVLAAALATGKINLNQTFMSGHTYVDNQRINDWNWTGWGRITFQQALEQSSNVGFATIALKLGWPDLLQYMKKFGYLDKTGIDLPNEASSLIFGPSDRGPVQLATSGFGQGIAVTPMQQIAAIGAIANGGKLMKPYIAEKYIDPVTHKVTKQVQPTVVNPQVVPPDVVNQVNQTMILDVSKGIDTKGIIPGYDVGGKTGTAQVAVNGHYYANRFIVSFIGYAPGWDPQFEVYVTLNWPKTQAGNQWGSTIATPAAHDILQACLQYARIQPRANATPPISSATTAATQSIATTTKYVQVPNFVGLNTSEAAKLASGHQVVADAMNGLGKVTSQWPEAGIEVPKGSRIYLSIGLSGNPNVVTVPDLTGASMRAAGNMLAALGLKLAVTGTGYVTQQSVAPGSQVPRGSTVALKFSPNAPFTGLVQSNGKPTTLAGAQKLGH